MNKKGCIAFLLAMLWGVAAWAYDFSVQVATGQTLYFAVVEGGVQVVYPMGDNVPAEGWGVLPKPSGAMTIPATVSDGTTSHAVLSVGHHAFFGCTDLQSVTLAEGVAEVGISAFRDCSSLTAATLPQSLQTIGNMAFANCGMLADVWSLRTTPPTLGTSVFYGIASPSTLHVQCNSAAAYGAAAQWCDFDTTVDDGCTVILTVAANHSGRGSVTGGGTYPQGIQVTLAALPAEGCFFACWNDGDTLNPRLVTASANGHFTAMFFAVRHDTVQAQDTVVLHDTLMPSFFTLTVESDDATLGVGVGSALLPAGTAAEVCGLPIEGARFVAWDDGATDNPRHVTVTGDMRLQALFERLSVTEAESGGWSMAVAGREVTLTGAAGEPVQVYDTAGRLLFSATGHEGLVLRMPAAGAYLVRVGNGAARKLTVK